MQSARLIVDGLVVPCQIFGQQRVEALLQLIYHVIMKALPSI